MGNQLTEARNVERELLDGIWDANMAPIDAIIKRADNVAPLPRRVYNDITGAAPQVYDDYIEGVSLFGASGILIIAVGGFILGNKVLNPINAIAKRIGDNGVNVGANLQI